MSARPGENDMVKRRAVDRLSRPNDPGGDETGAAVRVITEIVALWIVGLSIPMSTIRSRPMPVKRNRPPESVVMFAVSPGRLVR